MEATLIDEKELKDKFVEKAHSINQLLCGEMRKKESELGIGIYAGGLTTIFCSEKWTLEDNINNLLAVFQNNFAESMFFQLNNIKQDKTLAIVLSYLQSRGLEDDFAKFKASVMQKPVNQKRFIAGINTELSGK